MKGILLAGGYGTRLSPLTSSITKHLLPVYSKPIIYYSLSILLQAGIKDIVFIADKDSLELYKKLFSNGNDLGCSFSYLVQEKPEGIAQAFLIAEEFIGQDSCALVLGDNMFYGATLSGTLSLAARSVEETGISKIFACHVHDPERYGVVEFSESGKVLSIEEKPKNPRSKYAVPGIYFYNNKCVEYAKELKPSARGELEITDLNRKYLESGSFEVSVFPRGTAWFDTGTFDSLLEAGQFVQAIEKRQNMLVCSPEEICYRNGWISQETLLELAKKYSKSEYGRYLVV